MAAADRKITYTAAEVAELIRPLIQSVEALQRENAELKRKLEHMNEILANAQRARFGQSSEKRSYVLSEDQMSLFNEAEICFSLLKVSHSRYRCCSANIFSYSAVFSSSLLICKTSFIKI